jgi:hypothetical protein
VEQNNVQRMLDKKRAANQGRIVNETEQAEGVGMAGGVFDLLQAAGAEDSTMFGGDVEVS